jgi:hypothetical protein
MPASIYTASVDSPKEFMEKIQTAKKELGIISELISNPTRPVGETRVELFNIEDAALKQIEEKIQVLAIHLESNSRFSYGRGPTLPMVKDQMKKLQSEVADVRQLLNYEIDPGFTKDTSPPKPSPPIQDKPNISAQAEAVKVTSPPPLLTVPATAMPPKFAVLPPTISLTSTARMTLLAGVPKLPLKVLPKVPLTVQGPAVTKAEPLPSVAPVLANSAAALPTVSSVLPAKSAQIVSAPLSPVRHAQPAVIAPSRDSIVKMVKDCLDKKFDPRVLNSAGIQFESQKKLLESLKKETKGKPFAVKEKMLQLSDQLEKQITKLEPRVKLEEKSKQKWDSVNQQKADHKERESILADRASHGPSKR